MTANKSERASL